MKFTGFGATAPPSENKAGFDNLLLKELKNLAAPYEPVDIQVVTGSPTPTAALVSPDAENNIQKQITVKYLEGRNVAARFSHLFRSMSRSNFFDTTVIALIINHLLISTKIKKSSMTFYSLNFGS